MDVQKFSALKEWNVWTYQLQALVQCVGPALLGTLEMYRNAMVSITLKQKKKKSFNLSVVNFSLFVLYADIDECILNNTLCEQVCVNTDGSYTCACMDGYQLIEGTDQCEGE